MSKRIDGRKVAKAVYRTEGIPYTKGETYEVLDHYATCCPGCKAKLEVKLYEDLRYPDDVIVTIKQTDAK
jgi:hypothetical protein